jgi:DNA polymerase sigma
MQVIAKAKVPIIKFEDLSSGTPLNICFGQVKP